jgi:hypothetical protein
MVGNRYACCGRISLLYAIKWRLIQDDTMREDFDPYYLWLGIPPVDQPPDHYRLLGVTQFESDADVIRNAADSGYRICALSPVPGRNRRKG